MRKVFVYYQGSQENDVAGGLTVHKDIVLAKNYIQKELETNAHKQISDFSVYEGRELEIKPITIVKDFKISQY